MEPRDSNPTLLHSLEERSLHKNRFDFVCESEVDVVALKLLEAGLCGERISCLFEQSSGFILALGDNPVKGILRMHLD